MRQRIQLLFVAALFSVVPSVSHAQGGGSVVFVGTEVFPLGGATLTVGPSAASTRTGGAAPLANNRLYVGNLSFTTLDGFSAHMGGASGGLIGFMDEAASFPVGGNADFVVHGNADFVPCVRVNHDAAGVLLDPDFSSIGAQSYRAEVWNNGVPVAWFNGLSGDIMATGFPSQFSVDLEGVVAPLPDPFSLPALTPFAPSNAYDLRWGTDVTLSFVGGPVATGDELRMYPQGGTALAFVSSIDVLVTIPSVFPPYTMAIDDIAQQQFGRLHRGSGSAKIVSSYAPPIVGVTGTLGTLSHHRGVDVTVEVSTLGGIQVSMHPSQSQDDLIWDLKDGFVTGDLDDLSVTAELLTGGQGEVGKVTSIYNGAGWSVTPDLSGSGSPNVRLEIFDASGNLVGGAPNWTGPFTVASIYWPIATGVEDTETLALVLGYASPVAINLPGVGIVTGMTIKMHSNAPRRHQFFTLMDRTNLSAAGIAAHVNTEVNGFRLPSYVGQADFALQGTAYGKRCDGGLVIHDIDATGSDGVEIVPCLLPAPDQFGIEWAPLGPPSASMGQTDWAFVSKRATDPAPVERMAISMNSNGTMVSLFKNPGPTQTPAFRVILKNGGKVVADFLHSDPALAFAQLSDWPIGVGYQELATPDQPWSMWIDLGYKMDVLIPSGASTNRSVASQPLTQADLIEVIATDTPNPGPSERRILSGRFAGIGPIVLLDRGPTPTRIDTTPRSVRSVLRPAHPNPFNPNTTLAFELAQSGHVSLRIYAIDGSYIATIHEGTLRAGAHAYAWNGLDHRGQPVASGVYVADLRAPDGRLRTKLNLLK